MSFVGGILSSICAAFPLWSIVLTFHVPMVVSLERERQFCPVASRNLKLSPPDFILLLSEDPSSPRQGISRSSLVGVSVAGFVFRGERAGLTPNPQPGGPETKWFRKWKLFQKKPKFAANYIQTLIYFVANFGFVWSYFHIQNNQFCLYFVSWELFFWFK